MITAMRKFCDHAEFAISVKNVTGGAMRLRMARDCSPTTIARMWRFSRSNGITEGFHRKMKLIQRRAFGFRNFENDRRRVRTLCA